ncbi:MAG TPA: TonB-dependent receptor, partial [Bryobacteraceae bacterium]|nr:TonB-dependent receptor [Bryobacteraceae bacterium]
MSIPRCFPAFALLAGVVASAPSLCAQSTFGSIVGSVKDLSSAVVPAATIAARDVEENTTRTTTSNDQGLYELLNLKPGRYEITATKAGFSTFTIRAVMLLARDTVRADVRLEVSPIKESVAVTGEASIINTENGTISDTKSFREITGLPLNYRGVTTSPLIALISVPGVQMSLLDRPSIGGGLPAQIEYSLDGISTVNIAFFGPIYDMYPSTEMISEFKVISVNNSAEYGQMGDVTVITRGGTNQLHGSAVWYHQNSALDATIYGAPEKQSKVFNTFGGSLSGPLYLPGLYHGRDRTFFFVDYEGNRKPSAVVEHLSVPTASMRAGDLNGVPGQSASDPLSGAPFPNNAIPATRINSVARTLFQRYYPLPNFNTDGTTFDNYRSVVPTSIYTDGYDVRVDHVLNSRHQIFGRWSWKEISGKGAYELLPPEQYDSANRNLILSHNFVLRPNVFNESRFGFGLSDGRTRFPILGADAVATLGLEGLNLSNAGGVGGFPLFDFSEGTGFYLIGHPRDGPGRSRNWQFTDNLSWIRGRHSMKFGADIRRIGWVGVLSDGGGDDFGSFLFQPDAFSGNAFVDLLLGLPYLTEYGLLGPNLDESATHAHFYGQDQWQVNDRLTVSIGIRWSVHPPMTEASGNITNFDPASGNVIVPDHTIPAAPGFLTGINACPGVTTAFPCTKIVTASEAGVGQGLRRTYYGNWAPRVSIAWRPFASNKTVVRSGFGEFTQTILGATASGLTAIHSTDLRDEFNYQGPGVAPQFVLPLVASGAFVLPQPGTKTFGDGMDTSYKDPRSYQWNFTLEHALAAETRLRLSYIGSHSVGLNGLVNYNQQHASTTPFSASRRPYPAFRTVGMWENIGFASYEAFQAEATRRFARGLFFQASYIFSKNIGNAGSAYGGQGGLLFVPEALPNAVTDRFNTRLDRGILAGSRANRFLFTGIYELPWGKGRRYANRLPALPNALFGGWNLSTITLLESGPFQTAFTRAPDPSNSGAGGRLKRPDRIGDGNLPHPTPDHWYDITAFVPTPQGA